MLTLTSGSSDIDQYTSPTGRPSSTTSAASSGGRAADDWTIISPDGSVIDKGTFLGVIKSGVLSHEQMEFAEMKVPVYGETAVVKSRATSKGKFKGGLQ